MKKKWYRLDNAALIFPAIMFKHWSNAFRTQVTLNEKVDPVILFRAVNDLRDRFPTFFVKLRDGFFWHYLQENKNPIKPIRDFAYPLTYMSKKDLRKSCIRVLYFENQISLETFHAVTDGNGGVLLLKNIVARYFELKNNINVSKVYDVKDLNETPLQEELEDAFPKYSGKYKNELKIDNPYVLKGTKEKSKFRHLITGIMPADTLLEKSHDFGVSVTSLLTGVMIESIIKIQESKVKEKRLKPVNVTIPVNLRKIFGSKTFRNFVIVVNVGVNPRDGEYSLKEICEQVQYQMKTNIVKQKMQAEVAGHVIPSKSILLKLCPVFLKDIVLRLVYSIVGEKKGCLTISNVGVINLPDEIKDLVSRFEFIVGTQLVYPNNCSVCSYDGKTFVNIIRNIKESELERLFFSRLVELGIPVDIESN